MPAKPGSTQIGFVGLGIMGAPMALNLIKAGFSLKVYNRTDRPRAQEVVDAGAKRVATPTAAANGSDAIISGGTVSQYAVVCISCSGSSSSPDPTFSLVWNLIFLNPTTRELTCTSP